MADDCFARKGLSGCGVLKIKKCCGEACSFYKSLERFEQEKFSHIISKDRQTQGYIAGKYYDGILAWEGGGFVEC